MKDKRLLLISLGLLLWVLVWHGRAMTGYFYGDDWFQITPRSPTTILKTFAGDWNMGHRNEGGFYRPLVRVSFGIERFLWGEHAAGYHATALALFFLATWLVWQFGRRLLQSDSLAIAAALGFTLLPTQSEIAWWVSARADLLAAIAILGALTLWIRPLRSDPASPPDDNDNPDTSPDSPLVILPRRATRMAAWGLLILGLGSKELAVSGLILLPLLDAFLLRSSSATTDSSDSRSLIVPKESPWKRWVLRSVLPAVGIGTAYLLWRTWCLGGIGGYLASQQEPLTLSRVLHTYRQFLSAIVWPPGAYDLYGSHWKAFVLLFGLGLLLTRLRRDLTFAVLGLLFTIAPMVGLGLTPLAGGRFLLLPGAFGMLCWAALFPMRFRQSARPLRWLPAMALVFLGLTWTPTLLRASNLWKEASEPSRRSMSQTWEFVKSLPSEDPGQIAIDPPPIPHGYHIWAPGYAMVVALHCRSLGEGWSADWVDLDNPYPSPIRMIRPDGKAIRAWFGVPPTLKPGALLLRIQEDGSVHAFRVERVDRETWSGDQLASWKPEGAGRLLEVEAAPIPRSQEREAIALEPLPSTPTLHLVVEDTGFWLQSPPYSDESHVEESDTDARRWGVVGVTGEWNRPGNAWIVSTDATGTPSSILSLIAIPVPPMSFYRTAYSQIGLYSRESAWRFSPLDRPARVQITQLELVSYTIHSIDP